MKELNFIFISFLLLSFGIISCDKHNIQDEPNFISSKINDVNWNGVPEINTDQANDTLILIGVGDEKVIVFRIKFTGEGVYNLTGTQASCYTTIGGDVISSLYTLDPDFSSRITVTEYNSEQNIIHGNFELSLLKKWSNPENNIDSMRFADGIFQASFAH